MRRLPQRIIISILALFMLTCCTLFISRPSGEPPTPTSAVSPTQPENILPTQIILVQTPHPTAETAYTPVPPEPALVTFPSGDLIYPAVGKGLVKAQPGSQDVQLMLDLPEEATYPFLSPGGKRLGFVFHHATNDGTVHLIGVKEGSQVYLPSEKSPARSLTSEPFLAAWSPDENLVFNVSSLGGEGPSAAYLVQVSAFDATSPPVYWSSWTSFQIKGLEEMVWAPDSRALVFIAAGQDGMRFFVAPLGQAPFIVGQEQQLQILFPQETALAVQVLPGGRLLYATDKGIYLQYNISEVPHLVTRSRSPYIFSAFNASGRWASIYNEDQGGPFILDLLTGSERQLSDTKLKDFSHIMLWSPDGRYLAFTLPDELQLGIEDLYVTSPDGPVVFLRLLSQLNASAGSRNLLAWHPSQPFLSFSERFSDGYLIWLAAADGSGFAYLNPGTPAAESHIAWQAESPALGLVDLPLAPEPCVALAPRLKLENTAISSLEPAIVSLLYRDAAFDSAVIGSLNPGESAWVLNGPVCYKNSNFWLLRSKVTGQVGWAAEGDATNYILIPRSDALLFTIKKRIYALPLDNPELDLVADPEAVAPGTNMQFISPRWLPNGNSFSYLAISPNSAVGLYVQPYPIGTVKDLIYTLAQPGYDLPAGAWSPDGSRVVVSLGPADGNRDLFLVQVDGSLIQNLTGSSTLDDRSPAWSPDGRSIVFLSGKGEDTEMYILVPGESITRLTNNRIEEMSPVWSPQGNRIAYVEKINNALEIFTVSNTGTDRARLVSQPGMYPAWSPEGLRIAFIDHQNDRLMLVNADGSNLRVLALAGDGQNPTQIIWAPAGGRLAYVYQSTIYIYDLTTNVNVPMAAGLDNPWIAWQP